MCVHLLRSGVCALSLSRCRSLNVKVCPMLNGTTGMPHMLTMVLYFECEPMSTCSSQSAWTPPMWTILFTISWPRYICWLWFSCVCHTYIPSIRTTSRYVIVTAYKCMEHSLNRSWNSNAGCCYVVRWRYALPTTNVTNACRDSISVCSAYIYILYHTLDGVRQHSSASTSIASQHK